MHTPRNLILPLWREQYRIVLHHIFIKPHIPRMQYRAKIPLKQEHNRTSTVITVKKVNFTVYFVFLIEHNCMRFVQLELSHIL